MMSTKEIRSGKIMDTTENKVKLAISKNVHPNTDGSPWGWIVLDGTRIRVATWSGYDELKRCENMVDKFNSHYDLIEALQKMMGYIDDGTLVRNTENDANADWHIKMIRFVQDLKFMQETLKKATS